MKKQNLFTILLLIVFVLFAPTTQTYASNNFSMHNIVSNGEAFSGVIKQDGSLWIWGYAKSNGIQGHIPGEEDLPPFLFTPRKVMANVKSVSCESVYYIAVIENDDSLWIWGERLPNIIGELAPPVLDYGKNKPVKILDDVVSVSSGYEHIAALKSDGTLWMVGSNSHGQIGNGHKGTTSQKVWYNKQLVPFQNVPQKIMDNVVAIDCGKWYTAAIKSDGSLWMWGDNSNGQLGNGKQDQIQTTPTKIMDNVKSVSCSENMTGIIKNDGSLWICGDIELTSIDSSLSTTHQYSPIKCMDNVRSVALGTNHIAAIKEDDSLWLWGYNKHGQLGIGSMENSQLPTKVLENVKCVDASLFGTIALKNDGTLWGCGSTMTIGIDNGIEYQTTFAKILDGAMLSQQSEPIVTPPSPKPTDEPSEWAKPFIEKADSFGLIPEDSKKDYKKPITRKETCELIVRVLEKAYGKEIAGILNDKGAVINPQAFTDTSDTNVLAVKELDIVSGMGNNKFEPNGTLTRGQAAVMVNRIAAVFNIDTTGYSHNFADAINHWSNSWLSWPAAKGILAGIGNNRFDPDGKLTKEQAITIFLATFQVVKGD